MDLTSSRTRGSGTAADTHGWSEGSQADRIAGWLEEWHQCEWPDKKVYFTSVTEQWAVFALNGPNSRKVLEKTPDAEAWVTRLAKNYPLKRLGLSEDVASIALFLASDLSAYMSGAILPADGGLAALR